MLPGSVFKGQHLAPYSRLLQHIPRYDLEDPENLLILRAGGFKTHTGRKWIANTAPQLKKYLRAFNITQANTLFPPLYGLLHQAFLRAQSEECEDPFNEVGLAWVEGHLYFHYGRALANLHDSLKELCPQIYLRDDYIYNITALTDSLDKHCKGDMTKSYAGYIAKDFNFASEFYSAVTPCDRVFPRRTALYEKYRCHVLPMVEAIKPPDYLQGRFYNHMHDDTYAVFIDFSHQEFSIFNMYEAAMRNEGIVVRTPKLESGFTEAEKVAAEKPVQKYKDTRVKISYPVLVNACDFGYFPEPGFNLPQRNFEPLTMYIHKSSNGSWYLTLPIELHGVYAPFLEAQETGKLLRLGPLNLPQTVVRVPLNADGTPMIKRRVYTLKLDNEAPRMHFHEDLFAHDGEILTLWERLYPHYLTDSADRKHKQLLFDAFKVFLHWIIEPVRLCPLDKLRGEFLHIVDPQHHGDAPFNLKTKEERWNYLFDRGVNMDRGVRWLKGATLDTNVETQRITGLHLKSPCFTKYDEYAYFRALKELEIITKVWHISDKQRAEYIARRWLPWHTIANIRKRLPAAKIENLPQRKKTLPRKDPIAMKNFISHYNNLFGHAAGTAGANL